MWDQHPPPGVAVLEAPQAACLCGGQAREHGAPPGPEHIDPQILLGGQWTVVRDDDAQKWPLPSTVVDLTTYCAGADAGLQVASESHPLLWVEEVG